MSEFTWFPKLPDFTLMPILCDLAQLLISYLAKESRHIGHVGDDLQIKTIL